MAHALKRISYAACDPDFCQFAFLAREPKGHINIQFCHAFVTQTPEEVKIDETRAVDKREYLIIVLISHLNHIL